MGTNWDSVKTRTFLCVPHQGSGCPDVCSQAWSTWDAELKLSDDLQFHVDSAFSDARSKFLCWCCSSTWSFCHHCGSVKVSHLSFSPTNLFFLTESEHWVWRLLYLPIFIYKSHIYVWSILNAPVYNVWTSVLILRVLLTDFTSSFPIQLPYSLFPFVR